jgi:hypothetical protein
MYKFKNNFSTIIGLFSKCAQKFIKTEQYKKQTFVYIFRPVCAFFFKYVNDYFTYIEWKTTVLNNYVVAFVFIRPII